MTAFVFPGQGAQFSGMGLELFQNNDLAKQYFEKANEILGFKISDVMFYGSEDDLKQTKITQPAVFLHSVIQCLCEMNNLPDAVAGHSLGEISALFIAKVLSFEDALKFISLRATAMQKACELTASTMAVVTNLDDESIENICLEVQNSSGEIVVPANYNAKGQLVISGSLKGIELASEQLLSKGARRVMTLKVGGAFHSPLMQVASEELALAVENIKFNEAVCPVFQNFDAQKSQNPQEIKKKLLSQVTSPVKWWQSVINMRQFGITDFVEFGPGKVLTGLISKTV
jgi:[acyl-carrier-protein] S-malonyltransferase